MSYGTCKKCGATMNFPVHVCLGPDKKAAQIEVLTARVAELQGLLVEVYNHGENSSLHSRIGGALGVEPGECFAPKPSQSEPGDAP